MLLSLLVVPLGLLGGLILALPANVKHPIVCCSLMTRGDFFRVAVRPAPLRTAG